MWVICKFYIRGLSIQDFWGFFFVLAGGPGTNPLPSSLTDGRGSLPGPALGLFACCSLYTKACYYRAQTPRNWQKFPNDSLSKYQKSVKFVI